MDALVIHVVKKGRGPVNLALVNPLQLKVVKGPPRVVPGQVADYMADAMRVGPVLPIPDMHRNVDDFYGKLAHCVGRPAGGKLNDGDIHTALVSREVFRILGSGALARCVEVQVVDNAGRALACKKLRRDLGRWFNDENPFPAAQGAPVGTLAQITCRPRTLETDPRACALPKALTRHGRTIPAAPDCGNLTRPLSGLRLSVHRAWAGWSQEGE